MKLVHIPQQAEALLQYLIVLENQFLFYRWFVNSSKILIALRNFELVFLT
jgi:hypothetical protein